MQRRNVSRPPPVPHPAGLGFHPSLMSTAFISPRPASRRGFALLITIVLVAFLVLVLVGLAAFTRVETQVAGNQHSLAAARQNALMALNIAAAELQRTTGADRRSTVSADLTVPSAASPRWTGVYGNAAAADYSQAPSAISASSPRLLQWLVSGNEGLTVAADASGTITSATPSFAPSAANPSAASPSDAVAVDGGGALASATATSALTIGSVPARLLVGGNSVASANAASDFVVAPMVEIRAPAGSVPGLPGQTPVIGGYAWWVGDESTKAKINLQSSYLEQTAADQAAYQRYGFITAQHSSVGRMGYDADPANVLGAAYPGLQGGAAVKNLAAASQLPFVGASATDRANLASALKYRFHDVTAFGHGVLADAYAGGLKKDITADIANTATGAVGNRPADTTPLFTREVATDRVPTWGLLRSFARTSPDGSGRLSPVPPVQTPSNSGIITGQGVSPVINFAGFGVDFFLDTSGQIQVAMFPVVILWNPYAATLEATDYELGYRLKNTPESGETTLPRCHIQIRRTAGGPFETVGVLDLASGDLTSSAIAGSDGFIRFRLNGREMMPGEAQVYVLGSEGANYSPGSNSMVPYEAGSSEITNYVTRTLPSMAITPAEFADGAMRVHTDTRFQNRYSLDVVLARPGSLSIWNGSAFKTGWYQALMDATVDQLGGAGNGPQYIFPELPFSSASMPTESTGATTTMFASTVMEGRGGFNATPWAIGAMGTGGGQGGRYRWLVMGNPRAPMIRNTLMENQGYRRGNTLFGGQSVLAKAGSPAVNGRDPLFPYVGRTSGYNSTIGASQENGALRAVLFDVLSSSNHLLSLGQFQHASLATYGFHTTYPFGNSWADVRLLRQSQHSRDAASYRMFRKDFGSTADQTLYDLSWHLNRSLWDRYFVSGVPSSWTAADIAAGRKLPNGRMGYYSKNGSLPALADLRDTGSSVNAYDKASANLWVDGAFNVNSTSEQAWRALLGATLGLPNNTAYADGGNVGAVAATPRFSGNQSQTNHTDDMTLEGSGAYVGNRGLQLLRTDSNPVVQPAPVQDLINELARTIVAEIRARGPFLSVADFVNRRLVAFDPSGTGSGDTGVRGALQAAIDNTVPTASVNTRAWTDGGAALWSALKPKTDWDGEHFIGAPEASSTSQNATRFAACSKHLTQADLLSLIGPALTVRGDAFVVRTYGEARNPVTGDIAARAWCEAVLQRLPDYVDDSMTPETDLATAPNNAVTQTNRTFGRRYKMVSFRWLTPSDI